MRLVAVDERVKTPSKTQRRGACSAPATSTVTWPGTRREPTAGGGSLHRGIPMRWSPTFVTKSDEEPTSISLAMSRESRSKGICIF